MDYLTDEVIATFRQDVMDSVREFDALLETLGVTPGDFWGDRRTRQTFITRVRLDDGITRHCTVKVSYIGYPHIRLVALLKKEPLGDLLDL